ncbi:hypothetical protein F5B20DRAFT_405757 [Whalleya microplaca]|nr:hypothetical protein F5B20DRAFT_405757 [Whalleya microplaca]
MPLRHNRARRAVRTADAIPAGCCHRPSCHKTLLVCRPPPHRATKASRSLWNLARHDPFAGRSEAGPCHKSSPSIFFGYLIFVPEIWGARKQDICPRKTRCSSCYQMTDHTPPPFHPPGASPRPFPENRRRYRWGAFTRSSKIYLPRVSGARRGARACPSIPPRWVCGPATCRPPEGERGD